LRGGGFEYLHHCPESSMRQLKGSPVPWGIIGALHINVFDMVLTNGGKKPHIFDFSNLQLISL
jgi:hypothetical protein